MDIFNLFQIGKDDFAYDKQVCRQIMNYFDNENIDNFDPNRIAIERIWKFLIIGFSATLEISKEKSSVGERFNMEKFDSIAQLILDRLDVSPQNTEVLSQPLAFDRINLLMRFVSRNRMSPHSIKLLLFKHKVNPFYVCDKEGSTDYGTNAAYMLSKTFELTSSERYKVKLCKKLYTFCKVLMMRRINVQQLFLARNPNGVSAKDILNGEACQSCLTQEYGKLARENLQRLSLIGN